jgi:hypothetical protein
MEVNVNHWDCGNQLLKWSRCDQWVKKYRIRLCMCETDSEGVDWRTEETGRTVIPKLTMNLTEQRKHFSGNVADRFVL